MNRGESQPPKCSEGTARHVGRLLQDQDEATLVSSFCGPLFIRFCLHLCIRLRLFFGALHCFDNQFIQYRHIHII